MSDMAGFVKVWALAIALEAFNSLRCLKKESSGRNKAMAREVIYIICAMAGANRVVCVKTRSGFWGLAAMKKNRCLHTIFRALWLDSRRCVIMEPSAFGES